MFRWLQRPSSAAVLLIGVCALCIGSFSGVLCASTALEGGPRWAVKGAPRLGAPLCGFTAARHEATVVYRATAEIGAYNHAAMLDYNLVGGFFLSWKNCQRDEDSPGQRILFAQSADGRCVVH
jgi:hypothetical protein